jgi:hypothetical protein
MNFQPPKITRPGLQEKTGKYKKEGAFLQDIGEPVSGLDHAQDEGCSVTCGGEPEQISNIMKVHRFK